MPEIGLTQADLDKLVQERDAMEHKAQQYPPGSKRYTHYMKQAQYRDWAYRAALNKFYDRIKLNEHR